MDKKKLSFEYRDTRIYTGNNDLSKIWYVSFKHPITGLWDKKSGNINKISHLGKRIAAAKELADEILASFSSDVKKTKRDTFAKKKIGYKDTLLTLFIKSKLEELRGNIEPSSYFSYRTKVYSFCKFLSNQKFKVVTVPAVQQYFLWLKNVENVKNPTTINSYRGTLHTIFEIVVKENKFIKNGYSFNPFKEVPKLKERRDSLNFFSDAQLEVLIPEIKKDPILWLAVQLLMYCFIRPKEIRFLKINDIDIDNGFIVKRANVAKDASRYGVQIPDAFMPYLEKLNLSKYQPNLYLLGLSEVGADKPISKNVLYRRFKKILDALNFGDGYSFYSFKPTGAIMAKNGGADLLDISRQMGHHSIAQTNDYLERYGCTNMTTIRGAFKKF